MNRKKITALLFVSGVLFLSSCSNHAGEAEISNQFTSEIKGVDTLLDLEGARNKELTVLRKDEKEYGTNIVYGDENYEYYVSEIDNNIISVVMTEDTKKSLEDVYLQKEPESITPEDADKITADIMRKLYSDYDKKEYRITGGEPTGSYIEQYIYMIEEIKNNSIINTASISIAYDGQITSIFATYNNEEMFQNEPLISESEAKEIVLIYILEQKAIAEKAALEQMELEDEEQKPVMENELPTYEIYVETIDDFQQLEIAQVMHKGKQCYQLEFGILTSYGSIDSIFNPYYAIMVDMESGEVLDVFLALGGIDTD